LAGRFEIQRIELMAIIPKCGVITGCVALGMVLIPIEAHAENQYLTAVTSEVFLATGTPKELATRASTCISQILAPGTVDAQLIISSDLDGGVVVARNALEYGGVARQKIRGRFTFEARDGRFRIEQTNLEAFSSVLKRWASIGKWAGSGWKKAEAAFASSATEVANCVIGGPKRDDW